MFWLFSNYNAGLKIHNHRKKQSFKFYNKLKYTFSTIFFNSSMDFQFKRRKKKRIEKIESLPGTLSVWKVSVLETSGGRWESTELPNWGKMSARMFLFGISSWRKRLPSLDDEESILMIANPSFVKNKYSLKNCNDF